MYDVDEAVEGRFEAFGGGEECTEFWIHVEDPLAGLGVVEGVAGDDEERFWL